MRSPGRVLNPRRDLGLAATSGRPVLRGDQRSSAGDIDAIEYNDPLVSLLGEGWSLLLACPWRGEIQGQSVSWEDEDVEDRALAVKAIHSLGRIPGPEAEAALVDLLHHEDHVLRRRVQRVLERWRTDPPDRAFRERLTRHYERRG